MNKITEEELISYSEAYDVYKLYSEEDKKRIPKEFVKKLESIVKNNPKYIGKIKSFEDMKNTNFSKEAKKLIVYMGLNI